MNYCPILCVYPLYSLNHIKPSTMIKEFQKEYRWLSNFYPATVHFRGHDFQSVEHAYQRAKSDDPDWIAFCANPQTTAGMVKKKSRHIKVRDNWDEVKVQVMELLTERKYRNNPTLLSLLLATKDMSIQEGNRWGDKFWGVCLKTNVGENRLGKIIMNVREKLATQINEKL